MHHPYQVIPWRQGILAEKETPRHARPERYVCPSRIEIVKGVMSMPREHFRVHARPKEEDTIGDSGPRGGLCSRGLGFAWVACSMQLVSSPFVHFLET